MKEEDIQFILDRQKSKKSGIKQEIKEEISEEEAIKIYNELIAVLSEHNLSYKCAYNIVISLFYSFMVGAAELYDIDINS